MSQAQRRAQALENVGIVDKPLPANCVLHFVEVGSAEARVLDLNPDVASVQQIGGVDSYVGVKTYDTYRANATQKEWRNAYDKLGNYTLSWTLPQPPKLYGETKALHVYGADESFPSKQKRSSNLSPKRMWEEGWRVLLSQIRMAVVRFSFDNFALVKFDDVDDIIKERDALALISGWLFRIFKDRRASDVSLAMLTAALPALPLTGYVYEHYRGDASGKELQKARAKQRRLVSFMRLVLTDESAAEQASCTWTPGQPLYDASLSHLRPSDDVVFCIPLVPRAAVESTARDGAAEAAAAENGLDADSLAKAKLLACAVLRGVFVPGDGDEGGYVERPGLDSLREWDVMTPLLEKKDWAAAAIMTPDDVELKLSRVATAIANMTYSDLDLVIQALCRKCGLESGHRGGHVFYPSEATVNTKRLKQRKQMERRELKRARSDGLSGWKQRIEAECQLKIDALQHEMVALQHEMVRRQGIFDEILSHLMPLLDSDSTRRQTRGTGREPLQGRAAGSARDSIIRMLGIESYEDLKEAIRARYLSESE